MRKYNSMTTHYHKNIYINIIWFRKTGESDKVFLKYDTDGSGAIESHAACCVPDGSTSWRKNLARPSTPEQGGALNGPPFRIVPWLLFGCTNAEFRANPIEAPFSPISIELCHTTRVAPTEMSMIFYCRFRNAPDFCTAAEKAAPIGRWWSGDLNQKRHEKTKLQGTLTCLDHT